MRKQNECQFLLNFELLNSLENLSSYKIELILGIIVKITEMVNI